MLFLSLVIAIANAEREYPPLDGQLIKQSVKESYTGDSYALLNVDKHSKVRLNKTMFCALGNDRISFIVVRKEEIRIAVHIQPNASQNKVTGFRDGALKVRIAAPPTKGKANQELIKFLSSLLGVSRNNLSIEKGITSRNKTLAVRGLEQNQVMRLLEKYRTKAN